MSSSYRLELDKWLSQLDVKANRVLDIGGAQLSLPKRVKSWDVDEYIIADLPEPHADSPKPDITLDLNKGFIVDKWPDFMKNEWDYIFCLEVFDYVYDPAQAMKIIGKLLTSNKTKVWVTFPSFYPTHNPVEDDSLRYMEGGIRKLAEVGDLKIEDMIKRRPETNALDQLWRAERMRAAKHYDHNFTGFIVKFTK